MQEVTLTNALTHYDKSRTLLNLMVSLWFVKAKAKVDRSYNTSRKKKWARLKPFEMNILIPLTTKNTYYLVDRPAGLLLPHTKVPSLTWARFFTWLEKQSTPATAPNSAIQSLIDNGSTLDGITAALADTTTWEGPAGIWKIVDENKDDVILVAGAPSNDEDVVSMIRSEIFQNFEFQSAIYTYNTPAEEGKPAYYTAALALSDEAFSESDRNKTIYVINLGQFKPTDDDDTGDDGDTGDGDETETGDNPDDAPSDDTEKQSE